MFIRHLRDFITLNIVGMYRVLNSQSFLQVVPTFTEKRLIGSTLCYIAYKKLGKMCLFEGVYVHPQMEQPGELRLS